MDLLAVCDLWHQGILQKILRELREINEQLAREHSKTKQPRPEPELAEEQRIEEQRIYEALPKGRCPNCQAVIPLASQACPKCTAALTADGGWRVLPLDNK
ncbi:MAG: zinc ribbon domain-containing protein [Gammaproteobacteria bacterium]|nr:zinc ribbon domain-containing protein [Gammaproteobacteria bacterium]